MDQENTSYTNSNLDGSPENSGMKIPDGYMESFDKRILSRIKSESENQVQSIPVKTTTSKSKLYRIGLSIAVAASLVWAVFVLTETFSSLDQVNQLAEVSLVEVLEYENVDDYFFAEEFSIAELDSIGIIEENTLTSDDLYAYIIEENYSEYLLIETY